jgi:hypothetical protein
VVVDPFLIAVATMLLLLSALFVLWCNAFSSLIRRAATRISGAPKWKSLPIGFLVIWALTAAGVYWIEVKMTVPNTQMVFHHFVQIITGNWSFPPYLDPAAHLKKPFQNVPLRMAISISFAIVLNFAVLGMLGWAIRTVTIIARRQRIMRNQFFELRDEVMKTIILERLFPKEQWPEISPLLDKAVEAAADAFENRYLDIPYTPEQKKAILGGIEQALNI